MSRDTTLWPLTAIGLIALVIGLILDEISIISVGLGMLAGAAGFWVGPKAIRAYRRQK